MIEAGLGFGLHNLKPPFEKSRSKNVSLDCPIFSVLTFFGASDRDMDQLYMWHTTWLHSAAYAVLSP